MELNPIFRSNMVFAANKTVLVYGTGEGEAQICFAGQTKTVVSREDQWCVEFPPMAYGGPYELTFRSENRVLCFDNIYVGEVYLFAGQSNMELKMHQTVTPEALYRADSRLRLFSTDTMEKGDRFTPQDGWVVCEQGSIKDWSAIGYLAGSALAQRTNIAVGVIACYQGSSSIESWLPAGSYSRIGIDLAADEKHPGYFYKELLPWHYPASLYEFSLSQVIPFPVSAVIWYQGEGNTSPKEGPLYLKALGEFIRICREQFHDSALPFAVIQIADYNARNDDGWRAVQQAQEEVQRVLPFVKTVISADVCESNDIHPSTKHHLANRVAQVLEDFLQERNAAL